MIKLNLKNILTINAMGSLPFAVFIIIYADLTAKFLGDIQPLLVLYTGLFLVCFSISAWYFGQTLSISGAKIISTLDICWVISSIALVTINPFNTSLFVLISVLLIASFVMFCAFFQIKAIRSLTTN